MTRLSNKKQKALIAVILIVGLLVMLYPVYSNLINRYVALKSIKNYKTDVAKMKPETKNEELAKARTYNRRLINESVPESFAKRVGIKHDKEYEGLLNVAGNGMMGFIEIPSIDVDLPVFHYTTKEILENGAGHLFGSSLPVGGKSSHAVITAHRGLPGAKMFTDLDQLRKGDKFFINALGIKMAYSIDRIKTVKPDETKGMEILKGKDFVTLVTCTPYGQNTHRLLVRGHRVPYRNGDENQQPHHNKISVPHIFAILTGTALALGAYAISQLVKKRRYMLKKTRK